MPDDGQQRTEQDTGGDADDVGAKERLERVGDEIRDAADQAEEAGDDVKKEVREKLDDAAPS